MTRTCGSTSSDETVRPRLFAGPWDDLPEVKDKRVVFDAATVRERLMRIVVPLITFDGY
jgi:hypothetical protein